MVCTHTVDTERAFKQIENALKGTTQDSLQNLIEEIKCLHKRALCIQNLYSEYTSGSYLN